MKFQIGNFEVTLRSDVVPLRRVVVDLDEGTFVVFWDNGFWTLYLGWESIDPVPDWIQVEEISNSMRTTDISEL